MYDIRYAVRSIARTPGFAMAAVLTFALGIGLNVAVFSAVDRVLFRALPYNHPERLFVMRQFRDGDQADAGMPAAYVVQARQAPGIAEVTPLHWSWYSLRFSQDPNGARYFGFVPMAHTALTALGVRPVIGSDFTEEDARLRRSKVLITDEVWEREFGRRMDVIGRQLWSAAPQPVYEIAGVLPRDFIPPQLRATDKWSGIAMTWEILDATTTIRVFPPVVVRLKPGVSMEQAQSQVDAIVATVGPEFPARDGHPASHLKLLPLRDVLFDRYTVYVTLVFVAATMVLLVGTANLASLLLIRARSRETSAAIQMALGASRRRIAASVLAEALLLAASGSVVALVALRWSTDAITAWMPPTFANYVAPLFELRIVLFTVLLATASAIASAVLPAWRLSRIGTLRALQDARGGGAGRLRGAGALLAVEVALSAVLVCAAVLAGRTLANLRSTDVGFQPEGLLTVSAYLPPSNDKAQLLRQYQEMLEIIRRSPGVESAAGADTLPMVGLVNRPMFAGAIGTQRCPATDGLIETLGMTVIAGRAFTADEARTMAPVGVLSLAGLKFVWPGVTPQEAIGRFLQFPGEAAREVVGIVSDLQHQYLAPVTPNLFVPISPVRLSGVLFAVRLKAGSTLSAADLDGRFRAQGLMPITVRTSSVAEAFGASIVDHTFRARLFAGFGLVALLLAVVGIYAVQSFTVALRRKELGIRLALGAAPGRLRLMILRETARPVVVGLCVGLGIVYNGAHFIQSFLYGTDARGLWTFAGVACGLLAAAVLAGWLPARRASQTEPATVLRLP